MKEFDKWNSIKKILDTKILNLYFKEQEVWWCRSGINVGIEANCKGGEFARPVLILKKHNMYSCLVVSLTTQNKNNRSYYELDKIDHSGVYVNLSQIKVIDTKRLISKMFYVNLSSFEKAKREIRKFNSL